MGYSYAANTLEGKQKKLNAILNKARKEGYNINFDFQDKELKMSSDKVNHPYLTLDELKRIYNLDLSEASMSMQQSAFYLLLMATTGLRYSDLTKLNELKISEGTLPNGHDYKYIELVITKTNSLAVIPILAPVYKYIKRNDNKFPKPVASQTMNKLIKKIALKAMINDDLILKVNRMSTKISHKTKKWQHISSHTGRRSFITNFARYVPQPIVSMITHPNVRNSMFDVYNKITLEENIKLFFQHVYDSDELAWLVDYS